jgi:hypothetical protein
VSPKACSSKSAATESPFFFAIAFWIEREFIAIDRLLNTSSRSVERWEPILVGHHSEKRHRGHYYFGRDEAEERLVLDQTVSGG